MRETATTIASNINNFEEIKDDFRYGAFWPRFGAYFVDLTIILLFLLLFIMIFGSWNEVWDNILGIGGIVIYHTIFLSKYSSTPGKLLFGLKVVDEDTKEKINFFRAFSRSFSYIISALILGVGFLKIAFDKDKHRALHDRFVGTVVIQKDYKKIRANILAGISVVFYLWLSSYAYSDYEDSEDAYFIREGTREIKNQLNINEDLFKEVKQSNKTYISDNRETEQFDIKKELAAIVSIACPNDNKEFNSWGSGTIITESGIILTNYHVVENSNLYYCQIGITNDLSRAPEYMYHADFVTDPNSSENLMLDEELDIALLRVIAPLEGYSLPSKFPTITGFGSSDALDINDKIFVAGYPSYGELTITYTDGVVSGRVGDDLIKTSAKVDFGNSGGAAFNENGEFIGIPSLIARGGVEGLGYIIGIDSVLDWLYKIIGE